MKKFLGSMLILMVWLGSANQTRADDPVKATLILQSRQEWNVELLGRFHTDRVLLKRAGESGSIDLSIEDIYQITFPVGSRPRALLDAFDAGRFAEVAPQLESVLLPFLPYITDASSNLDPLLRCLAKAWYWAGKEDRALATCDAILSRTTSSPLHTEATAIRILSLVRQNRLDEASEAADGLVMPALDEPEASPCIYALASLQLARKKYPEAQELLARLIVFRSRDPEWMPPALLLSAEGYARTGKADVARQVVDEIRLNYPKTPWADQATSLELGSRVPENPP